jgi:hypothetical protein
MMGSDAIPTWRVISFANELEKVLVPTNPGTAEVAAVFEEGVDETEVDI